MKHGLATLSAVWLLTAPSAHSFIPSTTTGIGTIASGTGAVTPGMPAGAAAGYAMFMFVETLSEEIPTAAGWTQLTEQHSAATGVNGSRLTVLYRVATSATDARTTNDPGDHIIARILAVPAVEWNGVSPTAIVGSPRDVAGTSVSIPAGTQGLQSCILFVAFSDNVGGTASTAQCTGWANPNLTNIVERIDNRRVEGSGGTVCVAVGHRGPTGAYGNTTVTQVSSTGVGGMISFNLCAHRRRMHTN